MEGAQDRASTLFKSAKPKLLPGQTGRVFSGHAAHLAPDAERVMNQSRVTVVKDFDVHDGELTKGSNPHAVSLIETSADLVDTHTEDPSPWTRFAIARTAICAGLLIVIIIIWAIIPPHPGNETRMEPVGGFHHHVSPQSPVVVIPHGGEPNGGSRAFVFVDVWLPQICLHLDSISSDHDRARSGLVLGRGEVPEELRPGRVFVPRTGVQLSDDSTADAWPSQTPGSNHVLAVVKFQVQYCKSNCKIHSPDIVKEASEEAGGHGRSGAVMESVSEWFLGAEKPSASGFAATYSSAYNKDAGRDGFVSSGGATHGAGSAPAARGAATEGAWINVEDSHASRTISLLTSRSQRIHGFRLSGKDDAQALRLVVTTTAGNVSCDALPGYGTYPSGITLSMVTFVQHGIAAYEPLLAALILVFVYVLIVFELFHRTVSAMVGSFLALVVVAIVRERLTIEEIILWVQFETVSLLFGMMIMVAIFSRTGFFELAALQALKLSKGHVWRLTMILCLFTAFTSAFLDNVTTMLLMVPVTVRIASLLKIDPRPILLAQVFMSNIGGTATPVGDPPNIIIMTNKDVKSPASGITFGTFTVHMTLGVALSFVAVMLAMRFLFRNDRNLFPRRSRRRGSSGASPGKWYETLGALRWMQADWDASVEDMTVLKDSTDNSLGASVDEDEALDSSRNGKRRVRGRVGGSGSSFETSTAVGVAPAPALGAAGVLNSFDEATGDAGEDTHHITEHFVFYKKTDNDVHFVTPKISVTLSGISTSAINKAAETPLLRGLAATIAQYEKRFTKLELETDLERAGGMGDSAVDFTKLEAIYRIHDWPLFINCSLVLGCVIIMFFVHSSASIHLDLAWTALTGAMTLLLLSNIENFDHIVEEVEWSTLLFFAALFILMEALAELGLIAFVGDAVSSAILGIESGRLLAAILILLWVSAIISAFIDNIPYTTALVPIVVTIAEKTALPLQPLVWALAFGACLGGNGTLIGASANVVTAGLSEGMGFPMSFNQFFKTGFPVMIVSMIVVTFYMIVCHVVGDWNGPPSLALQ